MKVCESGSTCPQIENKYSMKAQQVVSDSFLPARQDFIYLITFFFLVASPGQMACNGNSMTPGNHMCNKRCWLRSCGSCTDGTQISLPQTPWTQAEPSIISSPPPSHLIRAREAARLALREACTASRHIWSGKLGRQEWRKLCVSHFWGPGSIQHVGVQSQHIANLRLLSKLELKIKSRARNSITSRLTVGQLDTTPIRYAEIYAFGMHTL